MNFTAPESLIFWTTLIFVIFFLLLKKFAWKPILTAVKSREESINNALDAADNAKLEMQNLQADNQRLLKEARAEREEMLKEAREMKNKMIEEAKTEASETTSNLISQAQASIESEKKAAIADLKSQVANLSLEIAEKVVRTELSNKDKQLQLVDTMLGEKSLN